MYPKLAEDSSEYIGTYHGILRELFTKSAALSGMAAPAKHEKVRASPKAHSMLFTCPYDGSTKENPRGVTMKELEIGLPATALSGF